MIWWKGRNIHRTLYIYSVYKNLKNNMTRDTTFQKIILFLRALLHASIHGKAKKTIHPEKIVALYLANTIGDIIFATSVFRAIKEKYPKSHLTVVGSKKNATTLFGNPDIDVYIKTPQHGSELVERLKEVNADFGFTIPTGSVEIASMILANIKSITCFHYVGVKNAHTISYKILKTLCIQVPFYIGKYVSQEYLRILEPIDIYSTNTSKYLYYDPEVAKTIKSKYLAEGIDLEKEKIIAVVPGSRTKIKQWPTERFVAIADFLRQQGFKIGVLGGPEDKAEVELFINSLKDKDFIRADNLQLDEMMYFISMCKLLIANDSGSVYIAESFNVPTLVVVGPTDELEHPPHGPLNVVVTPKRTSVPALRGHIRGYDKKQAKSQIEEVTVADVQESLKKLLKNME